MKKIMIWKKYGYEKKYNMKKIWIWKNINMENININIIYV